MSISFTAGNVMDTSAALLNDAAKTTFTYAAQLPYLKLAFREMRELLELNNVPVTNRVGTILTVTAGITEIGFNTSPALPSNLVEIRQLWERSAGIDPYVPMTRRETLSYSLAGATTANFLVWAWVNNAIQLLPTTQTNDLKLDYIAELTDLIDENSTVGVVNGRSFLEFRCAALCAQFISEDKARADDLNMDATSSIDRTTIIESKAKQTIAVRRRPFRSSFKTRG